MLKLDTFETDIALGVGFNAEKLQSVELKPVKAPCGRFCTVTFCVKTEEHPAALVTVKETGNTCVPETP